MNLKDFIDLIEKGIDVNAQKNNGETLLFKEVYPETIEILIKSGASVNIVNKNGDTALHYAAKRNDLESILLLLKYGANVRLTNSKGAKPADMCTYFYVKDFVDYISN